jgi:hypothetical protein
MLIHDFDIVSFPIVTNETNAVALVYSNAVLSGAIAPKRFQLRPGTLKVLERVRRVQKRQLSIGRSCNSPEFSGSRPLKIFPFLHP